MIYIIIPYNFFAQSWAPTLRWHFQTLAFFLKNAVFQAVSLELRIVISRLLDFCGGFSVLFLSFHKWSFDSFFFPCLFCCYTSINHITICWILGRLTQILIQGLEENDWISQCSRVVFLLSSQRSCVKATSMENPLLPNVLYCFPFHEWMFVFQGFILGLSNFQCFCK